MKPIQRPTSGLHIIIELWTIKIFLSFEYFLPCAVLFYDLKWIFSFFILSENHPFYCCVLVDQDP